MFKNEVFEIRANAIDALREEEQKLVVAYNELCDVRDQTLCSQRGIEAANNLLNDICAKLQNVRDEIELAKAEAEVYFVAKIRGELSL